MLIKNKNAREAYIRVFKAVAALFKQNLPASVDVCFFPACCIKMEGVLMRFIEF